MFKFIILLSVISATFADDVTEGKKAVYKLLSGLDNLLETSFASDFTQYYETKENLTTDDVKKYMEENFSTFKEKLKEKEDEFKQYEGSRDNLEHYLAEYLSHYRPTSDIPYKGTIESWRKQLEQGTINF